MIARSSRSNEWFDYSLGGFLRKGGRVSFSPLVLDFPFFSESVGFPGFPGLSPGFGPTGGRVMPSGGLGGAAGEAGAGA